jgi:hypothetical protein
MSNSAFCIFGICTILNIKKIISLDNVKKLIFVTVKCGVLFEVRTEYLNTV